MSKIKVIDKKSIRSINSERELLSKLYHPFIVNMHYAFQDNKYLYLILDFFPGGDLRYHISIHKKFSEEQTRFFICGITLSLEYIHLNNIIHRDIKPENLVLDEKGYVHLTDFGIAKVNMKDNSSETSGTPGYMSPEVIKSLNHSFPTDFFALGVIGYEFLKGERPYKGKDRKEITDEIKVRQAEIKIDELKDQNWSKESIDFINKLLMRKPEERLGFKKGVEELKDHPWLRYYPWSLIENKSLPSPFVPQNKDNFDTKYCKNVEFIGEDTKIRYEEILADDNYDFYFKNFYYNIDEDKTRNNLILSYKKEKQNKSSNKKKNKEISQIKNKSNSKEKNINKRKINKMHHLYNKINLSNKKDKYINLNSKREKSNLILINFNLNNITNNNINKSNINNYFCNNNSKAEKLKKIFKKVNLYSHRSKKNNLFNLCINDITYNQIKIHSPLNSSFKLKIKNNINNSKSKNNNKNKYNYNNSLIKKITKLNNSKVRLLKNKKTNLGNFIYKTNSEILSLSLTNREKDKSKSKSKNTISLSGINVNNSRKINNSIIDKKIKIKMKNESLKNIYSMKNLKFQKKIFDKKLLTNINNIETRKYKKISKNSIPFSNNIFNFEKNKASLNT